MMSTPTDALETNANGADTVETLGCSQVQHGKLSDRVYLMKLVREDVPEIIDRIAALAAKHGYGKVFAKVPASCADAFLARGYRCEARVPGFFHGDEEGLFLASYPRAERATDPDAEVVIENIGLARTRQHQGLGSDVAPVETQVLTAEHAAEMAQVYAQVFPSYPFPIHDPAYLQATMQTHVCYFGVREAGALVAISSAEMDEAAGNVEMTDFATLPAHRGKGLALHLLARMEREMHERGLQLAYTIARSLSAGMNITFARQGYDLGGTLVNNTNISGKIESMNVWFKPLR